MEHTARGLADVRTNAEVLVEARDTPHVLVGDDVAKVKRACTEQADHLGYFASDGAFSLISAVVSVVAVAFLVAVAGRAGAGQNMVLSFLEAAGMT